MRGTTTRADDALNTVMQWWRLFAMSLLFTLLIVFVLFMAVLSIRPDIPVFVEPLNMEMYFAFASPAPKPNPWPAAGIAALCLAGAVTIRFARRSQSSRPGCAGWVLLLAATIALLFIWGIYYPPCPPGVWC